MIRIRAKKKKRKKNRQRCLFSFPPSGAEIFPIHSIVCRMGVSGIPLKSGTDLLHCQSQMGNENNNEDCALEGKRKLSQAHSSIGVSFLLLYL